ncbi:helix-turn-helix domain-containing protein [Marinibaculum pumilum]|uniref:Helix-turn-helix domain-containing protein n=1 Tax=Marinibaculum pumilum TaxID=1766165 RepID=A0ABV7L8U2_9PROT
MNERYPHWTSVGERLRSLRKARGWTLQEVSARTGIAVSTLSKAERGQATLTYDRMVQLAEGLSLDVAELFGRDPPPLTQGSLSLCRYGQAPLYETLYYTYGMANAEMAGKQMTPMFGHIRARSITEFAELIRHPGEEFTIVLEGRVEVHVEGRKPQLLERFDTVYFDSSLGHAYVSVGPQEALVMCICVGLRPGEDNAPAPPRGDRMTAARPPATAFPTSTEPEGSSR